MKNYRYLAILLVFVIMAAVALAGCTSSSSPNATTSSGAGVTVTAAAPTPIPTPTVPGTLADAIHRANIQWYVYQLNSSIFRGPSSMSVNMSVPYNGQNVEKMVMIMDTIMGETTITLYTDPNTHAILGGQKTLTSNGKTNTTQISASGVEVGRTGVYTNPLDINYNATLTPIGPNTVTVPAGTFTAAMYSMTDSSNQPGTLWVASNAPLPVKYVGSYMGYDFGMELEGWG